MNLVRFFFLSLSLQNTHFVDEICFFFSLALCFVSNVQLAIECETDLFLAFFWTIYTENSHRIISVVGNKWHWLLTKLKSICTNNDNNNNDNHQNQNKRTEKQECTKSKTNYGNVSFCSSCTSNLKRKSKIYKKNCLSEIYVNLLRIDWRLGAYVLCCVVCCIVVSCTVRLSLIHCSTRNAKRSTHRR